MKYGGIILLILTIISCKHDYTAIQGVWRVDSPFYKATYQINEHDGKQKCAVINYNDGTSKYSNDSAKPYFLYKNIKYSKNQYVEVDGMSGATVKAGQTEFRLLHKDTLQVTTYLHKKPLKEQWIRQK